ETGPPDKVSWFLRVKTTKVELPSGSDLFQCLQDFGVLRLEAPIHRHIFSRVFTKEDQSITDVVSLIDGGRDLLHHLFLSFRANTRRRFDKENRHGESPFGFQIVWGLQPRTRRYLGPSGTILDGSVSPGWRFLEDGETQRRQSSAILIGVCEV